MKVENEESDRFLFALLHLGKEEAFDFIFRKYYKILTVQAIRFVHDQDSAQSLVQDCFVSFWKKRHEISNIDHLYSYLFFMVRNRCIDHLRKQQLHRQVPITNQTDFPENETEQQIGANDLNSCLWQSISKLPERCRMAFEYSRIDELTYHQVALKMGVSDKAVEALISRALKLLRTDLIDFLCMIILFTI